MIRTADASDVPALVEYAIGEARESGRWAPIRPASHFTAAHWRAHVIVLEESRRLGRSVVFWLWTRERRPRLVGHVGLGNIARGVFQAAHLGYALRKSHEGRGLMTEALQAIIPYAFDRMRLHRLMANYMPTNRRSARVLKRFRFRKEGLARAYLLIAGRWRDHVQTSLVNPRWEPPPGDEAARAAAGAGRTRPSRTASTSSGRGRR
ncbi:MAG TPA: GNAT family N-acetyltransferase [Planctomycetota bacterium]|nr:GNAT family N-acetyltransferase [Planctomycetota bacterium]